MRELNILNCYQQKKNNLKYSSEIITPEAYKKFEHLHRLATIYYAYNTIHSYLTEPFTSNSPLTLFNISRYVANQINVEGGLPPKGISML